MEHHMEDEMEAGCLEFSVFGCWRGMDNPMEKQMANDMEGRGL